MAREKKNVHKVQMTDGKRQIIQQLYRSMTSKLLRISKMHSRIFSVVPLRK